jgi:preprotein translocase subunit SecG
MLFFFTLVHVVLCVFMIFVILLQPGKDAGMGAALGGGAATSAFGGRGAVTFLSKLTAACAALFFLTSFGLSFVGVRGSVTAGIPMPAAQTAPASAPAPAAGAPATGAPPAKASDAEPAPAAPPAAAPAPVPAAPAKK